jgi:nucleotide-binding universal stress UspA family protein
MPVLLAAPSWKAAPKKAVFAIDFSESSMEAARVGLSLMAPDSTIVLTHVCPLATVFDGMGMWEEEYERAAGEELGKFEKALKVPAGIKVEHVTVRGHPSSSLLHLAETTSADLIVAGTRGTGLFKRLFVGSVAARLVHHAACSLLVVPDSED